MTEPTPEEAAAFRAGIADDPGPFRIGVLAPLQQTGLAVATDGMGVETPEPIYFVTDAAELSQMSASVAAFRAELGTAPFGVLLEAATRIVGSAMVALYDHAKSQGAIDAATFAASGGERILDAAVALLSLYAKEPVEMDAAARTIGIAEALVAMEIAAEQAEAQRKGDGEKVQRAIGATMNVLERMGHNRDVLLMAQADILHAASDDVLPPVNPA